MTQARARGPTPSCKQVYFDLCTVYESVCPSAGEGTKCRCTSRIVARRQTSAFRVKPRNATIATRNKPAPQRARHSSAGAHTARHRSRAIPTTIPYCHLPCNVAAVRAATAQSRIVACSAHHQMVTDTRCFVTDRQISFDLVADHLGPATRSPSHRRIPFTNPRTFCRGDRCNAPIYLQCRSSTT